MSIEMFNIHTSMVVTTEELSRLVSMNKELIEKNEKLELLVVGLEGLKQENEYLTQKLSCSEQIEKALRAKFDGNEVTLKAYRNASNLVNNYIEVNH